jgi:hypothetical protein
MTEHLGFSTNLTDLRVNQDLSAIFAGNFWIADNSPSDP